MAIIGSIFTGLSNIAALAGIVEAFAQAVILWWVQRQQKETLSQIADAAALAARANSDEERYAAAEKWREALSRPRVTD